MINNYDYKQHKNIYYYLCYYVMLLCYASTLGPRNPQLTCTRNLAMASVTHWHTSA